MKVQQLFAVSLLALASSAVLADQLPADNGALTRAEVRQSVIAARDAGQLVPAGEAPDYPRQQAAAPSSLTRSEVRHEVLEARAAGELIPAGEGYDEFDARPAPVIASWLTRAEVETATLRASDAGELIPAGEGPETSLARSRAETKYARAEWLARHSAPIVASSR